MSEDQLNSQVLMYFQKDIRLDYYDIIDMFAKCSPKRTLFINPLGDM